MQPEDLTASEISVRLGSTWLPVDIVQQFIYEFLNTPGYAKSSIIVHYSRYTGEWSIDGKSYDRSNVKAYNTYGSARINAYRIIEETLNLKDCVYSITLKILTETERLYLIKRNCYRTIKAGAYKTRFSRLGMG